MIHHHFKEISSTQTFLIEEIEHTSQEALISCESQTEGQGQYGRKWDSFNETLCFSFTCKANEVLTLTSLEIGCLIIEYFQKYHSTSLQLKWPNDILNHSGEKVGGILLNKTSKSIVVGIGLNISKTEKVPTEYKTPYGFIFNTEFDLNKFDESNTIYRYISKQRLTAEQTIQSWTSSCHHLNKRISIEDNQELHQGIFLGIGENGEALIKLDNNEIKKFYSGSVSI